MDIFSIIDTINPQNFIPLFWNEAKGLYFAYAHEYTLAALPYITGAFNVALIAFLAGIMFILINIPALQRKDREKYAYEPPMEPEDMGDTRWLVIEDHLASPNPAEWKLAVLEADNLLDEVLTEAGYAGDTLGERLTAAGNMGLRSVQSGWEAHKVRNAIAHQGGLELTRHEAERAAALFKEVLSELGYEF